MATESRAQVVLDGDLQPLRSALRQAGQDMEGFAAKAGGALGTLNTATKGLGAVWKGLAGVAAALAGGAFFKETIAVANKLNDEALALAKSLGVTGTEASTLRTALDDIGSNSETYIGSFQKFAKQLKTNEDGLQGMGLKTRDANGHLRDSNTLFTEALQKVGEYKPGLDQTTAAMTLFGKGVDEVMQLQKLNSTVLEDAKKKNEELGMTLSQEGVAATKKYKLAMNDMGDVFIGIKNVIGQAVMPILTRLAEWFAEIGPTAVFVFKVAIDSLATALQTVILVVKTVWNVLRALADPLFTIGSAVKKLIQGDMTGATNEMMKLGSNWGDAMSGVFDKIKDDAKRTWSEIGDLWGKGTAVAAPATGSRTMGDFGKTNGGTKAAAPSRMADWEAALAERKAALEREGLVEGQHREMTKVAELKYWQDLKAIKGLTDAERTSLSKKAADVEMAGIKQVFEVKVATLQTEAAAYKNNTDERLRIELEIQAKYQQGTKEYEQAAKRIVEIERQASEQQRAIRESRVQAERDARLQTLALEEQTVQTAAQLNLVTQGQVLEAQQQFEARRNGIAKEALEERIQNALLDPDKNIVEIEQLNRQKEQLELQHQLRLGQIRAQILVESQRAVTSTLGSIQSSWAGLIQKLMSGTVSIGSFIKGMFQSVAQAVIGTLSQIAAKWLIDMVIQKLLSKATAASQVTANAGVAGAAAVASTAAIPIVGPALAPAAGAAAFGMAMAYMPAVFSAAGGFDIPAGINPMVQTHAEEMILPAQISNGLRALIVEGGAGGGRGDTFILNQHNLDSRTGGQWLIDNSDKVAAAMRRARRDNL